MIFEENLIKNTANTFGKLQICAITIFYVFCSQQFISKNI